jgi:hypothetical protein
MVGGGVSRGSQSRKISFQTRRMRANPLNFETEQFPNRIMQMHHGRHHWPLEALQVQLRHS